MRFVPLAEIRELLDPRELIDVVREALLAHGRGEGQAPPPLLLDVPESHGEVQVKAAYREGGPRFVVKVAGGFYGRGRPQDGVSTSTGLVLLFDARSGDPVACLADDGLLTDNRTAAVAALTAHELGRDDRVLGLLGTGVLARLMAVYHAAVLPLSTVWIWGRTPGRVEGLARDLGKLVPDADVRVASSPAALARECRLVVTVTHGRAPVLVAGDLLAGTHVSAVGADAPGKQELDPEILRHASLLLVDSLAQCLACGEAQHGGSGGAHVRELGSFVLEPEPYDRAGITVADFSGLPLLDLFTAEHVFRKWSARAGAPPPGSPSEESTA